MTLVLLDNNLFNRLVARKWQPLLARIEVAVKAGRIQAVVTAPLLVELSAAYVSTVPGIREKALKMADIFFRISDRHFLRDLADRRRLELTKGRKLTFDEAFQRLPADIRGHPDFGTILEQAGREWRPHRDIHVTQEAALDAQLLAVLIADTKRQYSTEQPVTAEGLVEFAARLAIGMARSHMRFEAQQIGMPLAQVETMEPQSLPSFYWLASFASTRKVRYLAKKAEELVADSVIDPAKLLAEENETAGDFYDQLHFTDAAYADVLVTLDARFSELSAATRLPQSVVLTSGPDDPIWQDKLGI